jgi:hypothetical protein
MIQEPKRLGPRYARDIVVTVPRFGLQFLRSLRRRVPWSPATITTTAGGVEVVAHGSLDLRRDHGLLPLDPASTPVTVDVGGIGRADTATVAALVTLWRAGRGHLEIRGVSDALRRRLAAEGVVDILAGQPRSGGAR